MVLVVVLLVAEAFLTRDAVRGPAPPFQAQTLAGNSFDLAELKGRPAVIHFWATWCPVCDLEQGMVERLARGHPLISIAMQSGTEEEVAEWMAGRGVTYPVINDPTGVLAGRYGVTAVPASFVLDRQGRVRFVTRGYTSGLGMRARLWLAGWYR
ncbi:MAG: protein disulfide oxidoreductase [Gammaproteobacteria bacterium]|nr:protein disulfide oxidoreductase [Gammaproteobacteria bacterium]